MHHPASDDITMGLWSGNFSDKFQYSENKIMTYISNLSEFSDDVTLGCEQNGRLSPQPIQPYIYSVREFPFVNTLVCSLAV